MIVTVTVIGFSLRGLKPPSLSCGYHVRTRPPDFQIVTDFATSVSSLRRVLSARRFGSGNLDANTNSL